jgi:predicted secreted protein with PEFG-CTERM motif
MKTIAIGSIFAVFALMVFVPSAFADHATAEVSIVAGSSAPGCEETDEGCFNPSEVTIDAGSEVIWSNDDTAGHTVTSGTLEGGPDGIFDSSLFMAGKTFSHKFEEAGEFPYFCVVHPWMQGMVIVQEAHAEDDGEDGTEDDAEGGHAVAMTSDGSLTVSVHSGVPTAGEELELEVEFTDAEGSSDHTNYMITATQDGVEVLSEEGHAHPGESGMHMTAALDSDSPVDVQVTILGIGLPDDEANWTGPKGETVSVTVVPEFGAIAMMVLAVAVVSIVAVTARSKVIPKL